MLVLGSKANDVMACSIIPSLDERHGCQAQAYKFIMFPLLSRTTHLSAVMFHHITVVARTQAARAPVVVSRQLHATPVAAKTVTEKVSEVADTVGGVSDIMGAENKYFGPGKQKSGERAGIGFGRGRGGHREEQASIRYSIII